MFDKINKLKNQLDDAKATIKAQGKEALSEAFREFYSQHPDIPEFTWKHTRPYSDGDTTYFTIQGFGPDLTCEQLSKLFGREISEDYKSDIMNDGLGWHLKKSKLSEANEFFNVYSEFEKAIMNEDVLELLFGDHVKITVKRDGGIETEKYYEDY